jgi:flagellar P-ring protein precursor FlgI
MGAYVEREIPSTITDGERIMLLLKRPDFGTAENIQTAINKNYGPSTATALGAGTVNIVIPADRTQNLVSFIAEVEGIEVAAAVESRVVINERTGTLVVGGEVAVRPCHVAHGSLSIKVSTVPLVSQPAPLGEGETVVVEDKIVEVEEEYDRRLLPLGGTTAAEVAEGLNKLKVTPRDMITIFQALREAGVMDADLEIM